MRARLLGGESKAAKILIVLFLFLAVGAFLLRPQPDDEATSSARPSPDDQLDSAGPSATATPFAPPTAAAGSEDATDDRAGQGTGSGLSGGDGSAFGSAPIALPGLTGKGGIKSMEKMRVTLSVTSSQPIGVVGYQVPTSLTDSSGTVTGVGTRWSLSTIAYGQPDYARLFLQSGATGAPITCTITVNGRVTERRSTDGPYGAMMCQG